MSSTILECIIRALGLVGAGLCSAPTGIVVRSESRWMGDGSLATDAP